jgi:glycerophosphoryl diester phosphodiesterase
MAHRGASSLAPENSLAAFELAVERGADILETDLWCTSDGRIVCHHDATADRMCGDPRRIDQMSADELRRLRMRGRAAGRFPGQFVPTLAELLERAPAEIVLALELKDPRLAEPKAAWALAEMLAERVQRRSVVVLSFELAWLRSLKTVAPELIVGHITMRNPLPSQWTELIGASWPILMANPLFVRMARWRGRWVAPLDPDLHRRLGRYLRLGVDAVLTNDPGATIREIERLRARS